MVSIDAALSRIKEDWRKVLSVAHIEAACRAAELKWRKRVLDPASTILIFFLQVLHHNTAITNLPRLAGKRFTPGAYCQARARIPLAALRRLLHETGMPLREPLQKGGTAGATRFDSLRSSSPRSGAARSNAKSSGTARSSAKSSSATRSSVENSSAVRSSFVRSAAGGAGGTAAADAGLWLGHRVFLLDGSSCSMPDTPALQKKFGQPGGQKKGCGFPVANLLMLVDSHSGLVLDVLISPLRTHDLRRAAELHPQLRAGDLAVADRSFCSYAHVAALHQQSVRALFRLHQRLCDERLPRFKPGAAKPSTHRANTRGQSTFELIRTIDARPQSREQIVLWHKPAKPPQAMSAAQFAALQACLVVRIVRYTVRQRGFRTRQVKLLTTLLDPQVYPAEALAELYGQRWRIETNFRHLKQTLGLDVLHCKSVAGVEKEIVMFALVYNLVRAVMLAEAQRRGVPPDRISFVDALRHLSWPLLQPELPLIVNPARPGRFEPRVRKRRPKQYPPMNEPRKNLKKRLYRGETVA